MPMFMLNGKQYGGNGGNYQVAKMSKADYEALTDAQKNDGTLRIVVDSTGNSVNYMSAQVAGAKTDDTLTNLLNPTLETTTINGVKCTNNGDGTYTLNGTASANTYFNFTPWVTPASSNWNKINKGTYRFVGHKPNTTSRLSFQVTDTSGTVYNSDETFEIPNDNTPYKIYLYIESGKSFDNVTFKPMLTTDLSATYDDFVAYTGGTGRLNSDVAEHEKEISRINSDLSDSKTWKFLGNLNPGGSLNFPSEFKEINFCFVIMSGTNMVEASMVAPYDVFASVDRYYRTGYYANSNSNASFSVLASRSRATGLNVWQNGSDLTNTSNIACRVYYR